MLKLRKRLSQNIQRDDNPAKPVPLRSEFKDNVSNFDSNNCSDLEFVIPGVEKSLKLHRLTLSDTSNLIKEGLEAGRFPMDGNMYRVDWMYDASREVDKNALVKVLQFCYGATITVEIESGECCAVIAALHRLKVIRAKEIIKALLTHAVEQAKKQVKNGIQLLMCAQNYPECCSAEFCELDMLLAEQVFTKKNLDENHETVVDGCLMKLPPKYLNAVEYGELHGRHSRINMCARYVRYNSQSLNQKEKEEALRCDEGELKSGELMELQDLGVIKEESLLEMYGSVLRRTEKQVDDLEKRNQLLCHRKFHLFILHTHHELISVFILNE